MSASLLSVIVGLALVGTAVLHGAVADEPELPLPCRAWRWPCFDQPWRCTTEEAYQRFFAGPQPQCPVYNTGNQTNTPPGDCVVIDGVCNFTESAVSCQSWLPVCENTYRCATELEYEEYLEDLAASDRYCPPGGEVPPPNGLCTPINESCQWYNPCRVWEDVRCSNGLVCGSHSEYWRYEVGLSMPCSSPVPEGPPTGPCLLVGDCQWSECKSWLSPCGTHWTCGSEYKYRQYLGLPPLPCAFPGEYFQTPDEPGECKFNVSLGSCQYNVNETCPEGMEWNYCGPPCPLTCDNYNLDVFCADMCILGCFCPNGMVEREGTCILPSDCPINPCAYTDCAPYYTCQVNEITGNAVCVPSCEWNNGGCLEGQICSIEEHECSPQPCDDYSIINCTNPPVNPCAYTDCAPFYTCQVSEITGNAVCVPSCEWNNGGCLDGQICSIEEYDCRYQPCDDYREIGCTNPLAVECTSPCPRGRRCLELNGHTHCLPSCYVNNGGCGSDQYCVTQPAVYPGCSYGLEICSAVQCIDKDDVEGQCVPGKEYQDCGSDCGDSCDVYVKQELLICAAFCYRGCFCPSGLVQFRERCVDPLECWTLLNDPPSIDVLPLPKGTILLQLTVVGVTPAEFANKTGQFLGAVWTVLDGYRPNTRIIFSIYAVLEEDSYVLVYLMLEKVPQDLSGSQIASELSRRKDALTVDVAEVSEVEGPSSAPEEEEEEDELSGSAIAGVTVAATLLVVVVLVLVASAVLVCLCVHSKRDAFPVKVEESEPKEKVPVTYSKLQEAASLENDYVEQPQ